MLSRSSLTQTEMTLHQPVNKDFNYLTNIMKAQVKLTYQFVLKIFENEKSSEHEPTSEDE